MTLEKYQRAIKKLLPNFERGNERFDIVRAAGFVPPQHKYVTEYSATHEFHVAYLEFIRYNVARIEFEIL